MVVESNPFNWDKSIYEVTDAISFMMGHIAGHIIIKRLKKQKNIEKE